MRGNSGADPGQAQAIIAQLNQGADFATLAQKDSIDPGAKNGGELGWFGKDEMVPAFADAAFALQPGQYTKTPVQSQFGWHVILWRAGAPRRPALADVQGQIKQQLADNAIQAITAHAARANVKITINNTAGTAGRPVSPPSSNGEDTRLAAGTAASRAAPDRRGAACHG